MKNKITYTTGTYSLLAILLIISPAIVSISYESISIYLYKILNPIHLQFLFIKFYADYMTQNQIIEINIMSLSFYLMLLIGVIQYFKSNEKEFKLLRFCLSVIFIYQIGFTFLYYLTIRKDMFNFNLIFILSFISKIAQIFLSYKALIYFNSLKKLIPNEKPYTEIEVKEETKERTSAIEVLNNSITHKDINILFEKTRKSNRFLNLLIDSIVLLSIISALISSTNQSTLLIYAYDNIESTFGPNLSFLILAIVFRFIYYSVYEILLEGISPGKTITESRVISIDNSKITSDKIITRTLLRFIPFEPFSFFGKSGWHDDLSNTAVVNENKGSYKLKWILLIFTLFAFILIAVKIYYTMFNYLNYF